MTDLFETYRLILTTSMAMPLFILLACGVLYIIDPKARGNLGNMAILMFGFFGGMLCAVILAYTMPLIVVH